MFQSNAFNRLPFQIGVAEGNVCVFLRILGNSFDNRVLEQTKNSKYLKRKFTKNVISLISDNN